MSSLNPDQVQAIHHIEGPLLVLAGAGSGKTRVVTERICHLISMGVPPANILAVTFTNKAAEEMRRRVRNKSQGQVLISTFHSLGAKILRESIAHLGYRSDFTIYDEDDALRLVKACLTTMDVKDSQGKPKTLLSMISSAKNALKGPGEVEVSCGVEDVERLFPEVYGLYQARLKEYNAVDFDDLLFLVALLFREHEDILEKYQKRWSFILIDEYQDTNAVQYAIVQKLVEKSENLFVVGDPDQSIYSWRGADIQNILNFEKDFSRAKVVRLEQNYRSTANILNTANGLISFNEQRYEKTLWSGLGDGKKVQIYHLPGHRDETRMVTGSIQDLSEDRPLSDFVIFYRTNFQSRQFEDALIAADIPYVIVGGISFYQRKEIKDVLAFLRLVHSDVDFVSFARVINLPKRGIGAVSVDKLRQEAALQRVGILELARQAACGGFKVSTKQKMAYASFVGLIDELRQVHRERGLVALIRQTVESSGYKAVLREDKETFDDRMANIDELMTVAEEWSLELGEFLEELSLKTNMDGEGVGKERVHLMTLHNGKGLEFPVVFMVGMEEGLLPHINSKDSPGALEEERRLCYVGMTRAKELLHLSYCDFRFLWGSERQMYPSRFVQECPRQFCDFHEKGASWEEDDSGEFARGQEVEHPEFGKGIILRAYRGSLGTTYDVFFENDRSQRSLLAKYACLRRE